MAKRPSTRPDYIKWLLLAGAVCLGLALCGYLVWQFILPHSVNVSRYQYPVAGIDVSKFNGDIDYAAVRDDDYQFVFIKATEGKTYKDPAFDRNYREAREAGLKVGAYHFFRKNRTGDEQAANMLAVVRDKKLDLPLVIDLEDPMPWSSGVGVDSKTAQRQVMEMAKRLTDNGYKVMIYTNGDGYEKYYKDMMEDYDLWLCSFTHPDKLSSKPHRIQQVSHEGSVKGVDGDVDIDVFIGSNGEWKKFLRESKPED